MESSLRIGCGFDVHALRRGLRLMLGGLHIKHHSGLEGHSDGDVLLHAMADALLGAVGLGDIGLLFPSEDERWRGADSSLLLKEVVEKVHTAGWQVVNVDSVLIAQTPRLLPYIQAMRSRVAELLKVGETVVSIKATTTDNLGFVGRKEGIAAQVVVLLQARQ